jgi:hypothetical protein
MLRELEDEWSVANKAQSGYRSQTNKILNPKPKICHSTPTFAVLSQTVGSGVLTGD